MKRVAIYVLALVVSGLVVLTVLPVIAVSALVLLPLAIADSVAKELG